MGRAKCWVFLKINGKWMSEDDVILMYGLFGLEKAEQYASVCLETDDIEKMTWPNAEKLLFQLIEIIRGG